MKIEDLHGEDLSYTAEAHNIKWQAEEFFKALIEEFPNSNPREMSQIIYDACSMLAMRRILLLRRQSEREKHHVQSSE